MTQRFLTTLVVGALYVAVGCTNSEPLSPSTSGLPAFQQAPASGNGNKDVFAIDISLPGFTTCAGGATLDLRIVGSQQIRTVDQVPQTIETFNLSFTYSNAAGEMYVWHQVGSGRFFLNDNGDLMLSAAGRFGYDGIIGRFVLNLTTGELESVTGRQIFAEDLACAALT